MAARRTLHPPPHRRRGHDHRRRTGALLHLDDRLGAHRAVRFTQPDGLWDRWVDALPHLRDAPGCTPAEQHRRTDLQCGFADGWIRP
ncbi:DUF6000 family protein [Streptomyces sp. NPDC000348]|uniref:DUF6000 family protein n=1 Tax=Streptomyces sp. NPDC000348 TaxID=3364538 RepID=UPI0036D12A45